MKSLLGALVLALFATVLVANPIAARADGEFTVQIEAIDDSGPAGTAIVTILGADGRPLVGLELGSFEVTDNGELVAVTGASLAEDASVGIALVLAIDTSGSMEPVMSAARAGAGGAIAGLGAEDQAAVIAFAQAVQISQPLTGDLDVLDSALTALVAEGSTALYDAVLTATLTATAAPLDRRVVILLSDGVDDGSTATRAAALAAAAERSVPIYAIGFGNQPDEEFLRALAEASGGRFLLAPDAEAMLAAYEEFASLLRSQYVIEFVPASAAANPKRELTLTVTTDEATVTASRTYESGRTFVAPVPVATAIAEVEEPAVSPPVLEVSPAAPAGGLPAPVVLGLTVAVLVVAVVAAAAIVRRRRQRVVGMPMLLHRPSRAASTRTGSARASLRPLGAAEQPPLIVVEGDIVSLGGTVGPMKTLIAHGSSGDARLWWRDGKLMLHRRDLERNDDGNAAPAWTTLESGDEFEVGLERFRVEIDQQPAEGPAEARS